MVHPLDYKTPDENATDMLRRLIRQASGFAVWKATHGLQGLEPKASEESSFHRRADVLLSILLGREATLEEIESVREWE